LIFQRQDESRFTVLLASFPGRGEVGFRVLDHEWLYSDVKTIDGFFILGPGGAEMESEFEIAQCKVNVRAKNGIKYYVVDLSIRAKPRPPPIISLSDIPGGQTLKLPDLHKPSISPNPNEPAIRKLLSSFNSKIRA